MRNFFDADPVSVTVGETTPGIDASLALAGHITGTVTGPGGVALSSPDVLVSAYALQVGGYWDVVRRTSVASNGTYNLGGLPSGTYRVEFASNDGLYITEYWDGAATVENAGDIVVTAPGTQSGKNVQLALAGHVTGMVTGPTGTAQDDVDVTAYALDGGEWVEAGYGYTRSDGTYDVGSLPTGTYRIGFRHYSGSLATEYWDDKADVYLAQDISVTAGATTAGKNAQLGEAAHITGRLTNQGGSGVATGYVFAYRLQGGSYEYVASDLDQQQRRLRPRRSCGGHLQARVLRLRHLGARSTGTTRPRSPKPTRSWSPRRRTSRARTPSWCPASTRSRSRTTRSRPSPVRRRSARR